MRSNDEEWGQSREEKEFYHPTKEQLVIPPGYLRGMTLRQWLEHDLAVAIGPEYIDHGGEEQPFVKKIKSVKREGPTHVKVPEKPPELWD